jgi:hypothetical protein
VETNRPLYFHELKNKLRAAPLYVCFYPNAESSNIKRTRLEMPVFPKAYENIDIM